MKKFMFISVIIMVIAVLLMTVSVQADNGGEDFSPVNVDTLLQNTTSESTVTRNYSLRRALYILSSSSKVRVNNETKALIERQFRADINRETILLAGLAGVASLSDEIQFWADRQISEPEAGRFFGTNEWAANLVLARRGNALSLGKLLDFAEKQDFHTIATVVLVDLQYVPQPEVVDYLKKYLDSDERLEPVKPTVKGMLAANYAASSLARILEGFPLEYREDYSYSEQEIEACRVWMSKQKEWKTR